MDDVPVRVREHLHFDVTDRVEVALEVEAVVVEARKGFGCSHAQRAFESAFTFDEPNALAAATGGCLDKQWVSDARGESQRLFRRHAPLRYRNSSFYTKYAATKNKLCASAGITNTRMEPLIQDWEVPWAAAEELVRFCLDEVDLGGRPWAAVPIKTPRRPTLYPLAPNELYFNLGCYCQVLRPAGKAPYHYTKIMDRKCFELGGIKMLYSSSFMTEAELDERYNGAAYRALKQKYDPAGNAQTLYRKVVLAPS